MWRILPSRGRRDKQRRNSDDAQGCPCSQTSSSGRWWIHCFDERLESNIVRGPDSHRSIIKTRSQEKVAAPDL